MSKGIFLINGIRISYHLIDAAIHWAQENDGTLMGVYIFSDEENAESYGFPSDIEKVETEVSEEEAEAELESLISKNRLFAEKQCALHHIPVETIQLKNPDPDTLEDYLETADVLWLDPETYEGDSEADADLSLEDIHDLTSAAIIEVSE